ncbi:GNAT family N-acetyltransferase [Nocardioides solisilvae]|uniref:GNAT family N-acetyltransferase n=1 Tax=Nocardioides solisilvae TaxID=1542435 RepID=UPI000D743D55|nr:GNAT family protein [Nocardioides solisilvae]
MPPPPPPSAAPPGEPDVFLPQAREGVRRLEADRADPVGRGLLGEAHDRLSAPPEWLLEARRRLLLPRLPELPLRTQRLLLRRIRPDDAPALAAYYGRPDVAAYLPFGPLTLEETAAKLARRLPQEEEPEPPLLGLAVEHEGRLVGDLLLMFRPPEWSVVEIGWAMHPDVAGRGFATEAARAALDLAFGHYGFHRVDAQLDPRNTASARLCERLGMRLESHTRRDYWCKGEWADSLRYAVLAEEHVARG